MSPVTWWASVRAWTRSQPNAKATGISLSFITHFIVFFLFSFFLFIDFSSSPSNFTLCLSKAFKRNAYFRGRTRALDRRRQEEVHVEAFP